MKKNIIYSLMDEFTAESRISIFDKLEEEINNEKLTEKTVNGYGELIGDDPFFKNLKKIIEHQGDDDDVALPWEDIMDDFVSTKSRYIGINYDSDVISMFPDTDRLSVDNDAMYERVEEFFETRMKKIVKITGIDGKYPTYKTIRINGADYYEALLDILFRISDGEKMDKREVLTILRNIALESKKMVNNNSWFLEKELDELVKDFDEKQLRGMLRSLYDNFRQLKVYHEPLEHKIDLDKIKSKRKRD